MGPPVLDYTAQFGEKPDLGLGGLKWQQDPTGLKVKPGWVKE